jgi:hypothetical protein
VKFFTVVSEVFVFFGLMLTIRFFFLPVRLIHFFSGYLEDKITEGSVLDIPCMAPDCAFFPS